MKVKLHVGLRSISGQRWSGQDIELGRSFCILFASAAHCEHIGAFPDSLAQFGRELSMKNYDKLKCPCDVIIKVTYAKLRHWVIQSACNNKIMYA